MSTRVLIVDFNKERLQQLAELLKIRLGYHDIDKLITRDSDEAANSDATMLSQIKARRYDLLIGHIGGKPSGYECLKVFKGHNHNPDKPEPNRLVLSTSDR